MLRKANNVFSVILGDVNQTSLGFAAGDLITDTNLPYGAVVLADLGNCYLDAAAFAALSNGDQYRILQGKGVGVPMMKTPVLTVGKTKMTIAPHKEAQQQITAVGYNGTTGALPIANNTDFWIKIRKRDNDAANRSQPFSLFAGPVRTDATGTQAELASMLVKNGYLNFKDEPANHYLRFEAICDDAGAATTAATGTLAATNGSLFVSATVSGSAEFSVDDYVRFGTATTDPVYKVVATSVAGITLDSPYVGTTGTFAAGAAQFITAVNAAAANFGVTVTGNVDPFDVNQWRDYYANRFTVNFSDSTTKITHVQGAFNGNGVWQQVAMDEYMSYGYEGEMNQLAVPSIPRDQDVKIPGKGGNTVNTSKYSALNIAWEESISGLVSMDGGKGNVLVYFNLDNSAPGTGVVTAGTAEADLITDLGLNIADFNEV